MRWIAVKCSNPKDALSKAQDINRRSPTNEELLEFSFRRIFDGLTENERLILMVLSIYDHPLALEAVHIASAVPYRATGDLLEGLRASSLVEIFYDEEFNDNVYTLLPITRTFVYGEVRKKDGLEGILRGRMQDWLEAKDIHEPLGRAVARGLRQGQKSSEEVLLQLAEQGLREGNIPDAERLYSEAVKRNPKSWIAHRKYAEFLRHYVSETSRAISEYRMATMYVSKRDKTDASITFREFGILLKKSGDPNGLKESTEALQTAVTLNPKDATAIHALGDNYRRLGQYGPAIKILEPLRDHQNIKTRIFALRTLIQSYQGLDDFVTVALLQRDLDTLEDSL